MRMCAWEGVLAGRPYACALTTVSMTRMPLVPLTSYAPVTDASNTAVAGVLLQRDESEDWHPVTHVHTSRRLRVEEPNYHANERETLAVIHALRVLRTSLLKLLLIIKR